MALFAELVRRAVTHPQAASLAKRTIAYHAAGEEEIQMPQWGFILILATAIFSMIFMTLVSYLLKEVIATLCMVESPIAAITVSQPEAGDREEKEGLLETAPTITLVHQKPITSSIRGTVKHLDAHAGRCARYRGFRIHILYSMCLSVVAHIAAAILPRVPGSPVVIAAIAGALCARLHAAWTHKIVSMPSQKSLWQRIPARSHWKTLALPAAIETAMPYVSLYLTCGVAMLMGLHKLDQQNPSDFSRCQWVSLIARIAAVGIFAIVCSLFLCLPAIVTLVRIEASILPEDEDTIVPFDRTFGGKVVSKLLGGTGTVTFLDAWRSFNWEARRRLIKLYMKAFAVMMGIAVFVFHLMALEIFIAVGPQLGQFLSQLKNQG